MTINPHAFIARRNWGQSPVSPDTNFTDLRSTTKKSSTGNRCSEREAQVMLEGDSERITAIIRRKPKVTT